MKKWLFVLELIYRSILPPFYSFSYMEKVCKRKQEKNPNDPQVMWFLGNLYVWHKKYPEAQFQLEYLIKLWRKHKGVKLLLSQVCFNMEEYAKVINVLASSGILSEKDKENYYLGVSLFFLEDYDGAIKFLKKYVKYYPKHYEPFWRLGYAYYMIGLYEQALQAYRKAEKLNPSIKEIKEGIDLCLDNLGYTIH